jgi:hypothetical protein
MGCLLVDWCSALCAGGLVDKATKNFLSIFITWTILASPTRRHSFTLSCLNEAPPLVRHWNAAIQQRLIECLKVRRRLVEGEAVQISATKQFGLTDEEIAAILKALGVRINDLHRLADNIAPAMIPGTCGSRQSICRSFTISSRPGAERP